MKNDLKYDFVLVGTRVPADVRDNFKRYAEESASSPSQILRQYIYKCLAESYPHSK